MELELELVMECFIEFLGNPIKPEIKVKKLWKAKSAKRNRRYLEEVERQRKYLCCYVAMLRCAALRWARFIFKVFGKKLNETWSYKSLSIFQNLNVIRLLGELCTKQATNQLLCHFPNGNDSTWCNYELLIFAFTFSTSPVWKSHFQCVAIEHKRSEQRQQRLQCNWSHCFKLLQFWLWEFCLNK